MPSKSIFGPWSIGRSLAAPLAATAAATLTLAMAAAPAWAQNAYVELGAGAAHADADCAGTTSCDRNSATVRATLGYAFAPNWAAELTLADLGRLKAAGFVPGVGTVQASAKLRGVGLGIAGTLPLSQALSLTGRLGLSSNKTSISGTAVGTTVSDHQRNTAAYAGLGLYYTLGTTASLGLTLDRNEAEYGGEKLAVVALGLGARFSF